MERTIDYRITDKEKGKDIHSFLREKGYSRHLLSSMKPDRNAVRVNDVHEPMYYTLRKGDVLTIRVYDSESSANIKPAPVPFSVIYEDDDILVIDKPPGESIHPAPGHPSDTLANGVVLYYEKQGIPFVVRCINRLDRDTSGLLIIAKNTVSACILERSLRRREIHRTYLALAEGNLPDEGTIDLPIARKEGSLIERCVDREHGDRAVTHFKKISYYPDGDYSLAELRLETGRTHQIRVHLAFTGHPLAGDTLYNPVCARKPDEPAPEGVLIGRQALHSWKLDFIHPVTEKPMHFEAELPDDMARLACGSGRS